MTTKCEVLKTVRKDVEQNGIITLRYHKDGCYCAVGYVLKALGVTDEELDLLGPTRIDLVLDPQASSPVTQDMAGSIASRVREAGFSVWELKALQSVNDLSHEAYSVIASIDMMMESSSC